MKFKQKFFYLSLLMIFLVNIIFRYPRDTHEGGVDGLLMHALSNTITENGNLGWLISPFSAIGFYPFSYASGHLVFLSALKQVIDIPSEFVILLAGMILGLFGILTILILSREIFTDNKLSLLVSLFFSLSPLLVRFTTWQGSTRGIFMVFMPLWIWFLLRIYSKNYERFRLIFLLLFTSLIMLSFHRVGNFLGLVVISYLFTMFSIRYKFNEMLPKFKYNFFPFLFIFTIFTVICLQVYNVGIYQGYNLGAKYITGRFLNGDEGYIIFLNMAIDYGSRAGFYSVLSVIGTIHLLMLNTYKPQVRIFLLSSIFCFSFFFALGLYVTLIFLPFLIVLASLPFNTFFKTSDLNSLKSVAAIMIIVIPTVAFSHFMLSSWGTYNSTIEENEYNTAIYSKHYIESNETIVADGAWAVKLVTISDSNFMGTDITPLPLAYGWVSEEYILTNYNFSDAIIHKTLVRSDENLDMEKAWEERMLQLYTKDVSSGQKFLEEYNIKYAYNHKYVTLGQNDYILVKSVSYERFKMFESDDIELFYIR